jgi:hypothetical protein
MFTNQHPVFLWIYRVTRNWSSLSDIIPSMRFHTRAVGNVKDSFRPGSSKSQTNLALEQPVHTEDYSILFREMFCVAAADLAERINEPLENLGALYDEIVTTGVFRNRKKGALGIGKGFSKDSSSDRDIEAAAKADAFIFGRGQLLFTVRQADEKDAAHLTAAGYRFASVNNVIEILARTLQVEQSTLRAHIDSMSMMSHDEHILEPGVHLAAFCLRPNVSGKFDILVRKDARNQLPTMQLPIAGLDYLHDDIIRAMEGMPVTSCLRTLKDKKYTANHAQQIFIEQLYDTLVALAEYIEQPEFQDAILISKRITAPCRALGENPIPGKATLIVFRVIFPIHLRVPSARLTWTPSLLFRTQQLVYNNAPDHQVFARKVHREFAAIKEASSKRERWGGNRPNADPNFPKLYPSPNSSALQSPTRWNFRRPSTARSSQNEKALTESQSFGGIMVSQSVSVDVREALNDSGVEMKALGTINQAVKEEEDDDTFADQLYTMTVEAEKDKRRS